MSRQEQVEFNDGIDTLYGSFSAPANVNNFPLVILATGDGPSGSKGQTWRQFVPLLNSAGIGTFLFDFSGLGNSPGIYQELTLSKGCRNFRAAVNFVTENGDHNKERIGVIGASYGGNVALLEAASLPIVKAIGLKSPSTFLPEGYQIQYGAELMENWGKDGYSDEVGLNYEAVLDSLKHNTYVSASKIEAPVRIVHGTHDTAVPIRHVRDLITFLKKGSIYEIPNADHWYANGNEWELMAKDLVKFMVDTL